MKIVIIGSGNVATHLGKGLQKAGHKILQVYSRSELSSRALARKLSCASTTEIRGISNRADFYLVALSDEAIKPFLQKFTIHDKVIVHTSGSVSISAFGNKFRNFGVF